MGNQPTLVAHRAGNDLGVLRGAEALGVDMVEADVHWFRGHLEVRHLKTIGPIRILWDRWFLASPCTPRLTLDELLASAASGTDLLLDLKGPSRRVSSLVLATLGRVEPRGRISVCARNPRLLGPFAGHPEVRILTTIATRRRLRQVVRGRGPLPGVSIRASLCTPRSVAALRRRTTLVIAWGIRDATDAAGLASIGVTGFSADLALIRQLSSGPVATGGTRRATDAIVRS